MRTTLIAFVVTWAAVISVTSHTWAQFQVVPEYNSPEVTAEGKVIFRIHAPNADAVKLSGSDIPEIGRGMEMLKAENGVWEVDVGPLPPGAYRYNFNVDGISVVDPTNPATSESNMNTWSLVYVPGSDHADIKDVPHGAVSEVTYYSTVLQRFRRMHVYTPAGYETGEGRFPVLYLLHGAFDSDDSWSTVGRAGFILDNLIAAGEATPMIVVMPAGHTGPFRFGPPGDDSFDRQMKEFTADFVTDIQPFVEQRYRVLEGRANRAIAGLSMGGAQAINISLKNLDQFAYIGVFSSGVFGIVGPNRGPGPTWEEQNIQVLDDEPLKEGLQLVWFATGKDDFLLETSQATVKTLRQHGFEVDYTETEGGHTWINWRAYLHAFAPKLFRDVVR